MKVTIDTQDPSTWPRGHSEMAVWHPGETDDADGAFDRVDAGSMGMLRRVLLLAVGVLVLGSAWPWLGV